MSVSSGNQKIGKIGNYSLLPGITCPWLTKACEKCYAQKANRAYPSAHNSWSGNTFKPIKERIQDVREWLWDHPRARHFRIHVAGDFDSLAYVREWELLILEFPTVNFLAFTRCWQDTAMRKQFEKMNNLPNCTIRASLDQYVNHYDGPMKKAWMGDPIHGKALQCLNASHNRTCDKCLVCWGKKTDVYFPIH